MAWNRPPPDLTMGRAGGDHFRWNDSNNLTAARARLAELKFRAAEERRLVTPPEELPSWWWFNPRRVSRARVEYPSVVASHGTTYCDISTTRDMGSVQVADNYEKLSLEFHEELSPAARAIVRLKSCGCRFPVGELHEVGFHFCNNMRSIGSSYCASHAAASAVRRR